MEKKELTASDVWAMFAETDRKFAETDRKIAETDRKWAETDRKWAETRLLFEELRMDSKDMNSRLDGIGYSNGRFAEEYFFNSLRRSMSFAGAHFDDISKDFKLLKKMPNGERLQDQFDIVMINDGSIAIIEVKYSADRGYPKKMAEQKVPNFRTLFPDYADCKIYLGLGSMSFKDEVVSEAKKYGVGLLKQVGEAIEYETQWVRAY